VKALVEPPLSADVNVMDSNGYTALMICTFCDRAAAAEILIKAGAEVRAIAFYVCSLLQCMTTEGIGGASALRSAEYKDAGPALSQPLYSVLH